MVDIDQKGLLQVAEHLAFGKPGVSDTFRLEFIGRGNVWLRNTYRQNTVDLARYLIGNAVFKTAVGQLSVFGYDANLSGVFAPFSELTAGANKHLNLIGDVKELDGLFDFLARQIQAVQNVIQGRESNLADFRNVIGRPVEGFLYVVLSMNFRSLSLRQLSRLAVLLQRGPDAGISFLLIPSNNKLPDDQSPFDLDKGIQVVVAQSSDKVALLGDDMRTPKKVVAYRPRTVDAIVSASEHFNQKIIHAALPLVAFDEVNDTHRFWYESSKDGLTFSVGKYGDTTVNVTIGDEVNQRHNALVTGAVGQGKSNLLSVIIHSLCQRYSPKELQLYLLDFKEGVSLKPYVNIGQETYLPHAKVVGLESDIDLGKAVLEFLFHLYARRMKIFKDNDVKSLKELREKYPNRPMARVVVIIDEFQLMFGDDMTFGQHMVDMLEKSVRLFRAAGIHFILASQSISGNITLQNKRDSIFGQIPIRISHKNSISESHSALGIGNDAAAFLRAREAIINLDYGEVSQNKKTVIAFADETKFKPLRELWYSHRGSNSVPPYVFDSAKKLQVMEIAGSLVKSTVPKAYLGERISINGQKVVLSLPDDPGKNIAILGSPSAQNNEAEGMIEAMCVSISKTSKDPYFYFCDFRDEEKPLAARLPKLVEFFNKDKIRFKSLARDKILEELSDILANSPKNAYVIGLNLDRMQYPKDAYGSFNEPLKDFVEAAPSKGIHFIGWWIKPVKFTEHAPREDFNTKIFLKTDEASVRSLTNPFIKWNGPANRALVVDEVEFSEESVFIPYSPMH